MSAEGLKSTRRAAWVCLALVLGTVAVYWPIGRHDFVDHDDGPYVFRNSLVQQGLTWPGVEWAFTGIHHINWHPLTTLSFMLDCQLFGLNAGAHHLVSLALHTLNAVLLFLLLRRMTSAFWPSALVAALFAWHPLRVESVAWVAERKDVLCGLFWLLTFWTYIRYVEQPKAKRYGLLLLTYALGIMTKPMIITLPFVLLLLDVWPLRRVDLSPSSSESKGVLAASGPRPLLGRLLLEKLPLFALSAILGAITFRIQHQAGVVMEIAKLPLSKRVANSVVAYVLYLKKTVWPSDLAVFYPIPASWEWWLVAVAVLVLNAITIAAVLTLRHRPYLLVGWCWFLGVLVPVIGLVQAGAAVMADRYSYIPLIGVFIMVAWGLQELTVNWRPRTPVLTVAAALALAGCLTVTALQVRYWRNTYTLFEHALQVTKQNWVAHGNFGAALLRLGRDDEAIAHFTEVVRLQPRDFKARFNLGATLSKRGRPDEAIPHLREAVRIQPGNAAAHTRLGAALAQKNRLAEALPHLAEAVRLDPNQHEARQKLAVILLTQARYAEAASHLALVLQAKPDDWAAHYQLGMALLHQGEPDEAIAHFAAALRLKPDAADAHVGWAKAMAQKNNAEEAIAHYLEALRLDPNSADAHTDLGMVLAFQGKPAEAAEHFAAAARLRPDDPQPHQKLGFVLALQGKVVQAISEFRLALKLSPNDLDSIYSLAWILGTHQDASLRDGTEALALARRAVELTHEQSSEALSALAAAQAEAGQFPEAAATVQKALELALAAGQKAMVPRVQEQLRCYKAGLPYRDPALSAAEKKP